MPIDIREIFKDQMYDTLQRLGYGESIDEFAVEWYEFTRKLASKYELGGLTTLFKDRLLHHISDKNSPLALWDFVSEQFKFYIAEVEVYLADKKAKKLEDEVVALEAKVAELEAKLQEQASQPEEPAESILFDPTDPSHVFKRKYRTGLTLSGFEKFCNQWDNNPPEVIFNMWRRCFTINGETWSLYNAVTDAAKVYVLEARVKKDREVINHLVKELEKQQKQTADNINALKRVYDEE